MSTQNLPDPEFLAQAAIIAALNKKIGEARKRMSAKLNSLPRGTTLTAFDPETEVKYGTITMSNPQPEACITDHSVFQQWCRETYPDDIEVWTEFADYDAAVEVVTEHAKHLLVVHSVVPGAVQERALSRAVTEDIPGTTRRQPPGTVSVRATDAAAKLVQQMLESSTLRLPELEA
ncbi:hypothetical protein [Nocardia carnea]|uniref:hypothetical protein n=1 Tax=Nocardia carnea TaxID=37328 RepID=UPI002458FF57|nr:hypothetical protein [Nocardia carnea]